jgi:pilus assembly protein CpaB
MAERRYTTIFAAALLTAGAATFGIYRVLEATKASSKIVTRPVVVALADVSEGRLFDRASVAVANWPLGTVPAGAFSSVDSVVGRVARIDVFKGEVVVPGRLAPDGTGPGLEVKITPGKRAIAVRIDDVSGLNGLVQPNSRVDILVTLREAGSNGSNGTQVSKLFMSNMRVLSIGTVSQTSVDNRPISAPTATIEVTPEEAEQLAIAQREGTIQLVLRGYGDPESIKTEGAKSADVLAMLRGAPVVKATPEPRRNTGGSARKTVESPAAVVVAPPPPAPVVEAPKPKMPDTATVQIFKGDKQESRKFVKPDSTKKPDPAKPPAPAV